MSEAKKGSQYDLQQLVNVHPTLFEKAFSEAVKRNPVKIEWLSPLGKEEYKEYCNFPRFITDEKTLADFKVKLKDVWPKRKPQWDGIALDNKNNEYLLIEAKAHIGEICSSIKAQKSSREKIKKALKGFAGASFNEEVWLKKYYQTANRLYFLNLLNEFLQAHREKTKWERVRLVYLVFLNDRIVGEGKEETEEKWIKKLCEAENTLYRERSHELSEFITHVYIDSEELSP